MIPDVKSYEALSDILPYDAIANSCVLSLKKKKITAVLDMHISVIESEDIMQLRHDRLMKILSEFPDNTSVSIYYCKNFLPSQIPVIKKHDNPIINYIELKRIERLEQVKSSTHKCFMTITVPLKEKKESKGGIELLDKISPKNINNNKEYEQEVLQKNISKASDRLNVLITGFCGAIGGGAFRLDSSQITQFLSLLLNHHYTDGYSELSGILKSDIIASYNGITKPERGGYVYYGGNYHTAFSMRAYGKESHLPEMSSPSLNQIFLHRDIHDIPLIIQHVIRFPNREKSLSIAKGRKNRITMQSGLTKNLSFLAKTPEGVPPETLKEMIGYAISEVEGSGYRFVEQLFQVHLWAETLKELEEICDVFNATVSQTYKLKREKYNIKGSFYSLFPGNDDVNPICTMLPSYNVADFFPIDMPRYCYEEKKSKNFIYYHTKEDQLTKIDLFDKRADNWNAIICGGSGSGKSFLANDILYQYSVYNPQIAIVDYGGAEAGSYRNFIINNKGTYLEINMDAKDFSINPFDGKLFDSDGGLTWKSLSLLATIERMALDTSGNGITSETRYHLTEELGKYFLSKNNNEKNDCNLTEFAEKHLKGNPQFQGDQDLYKRIYLYIGDGVNEGPYARFFKKTNDIKNKDFICFDLAGLKGHAGLKAVLIPALLEMICSNVLGSSEKERKKLLVMDEAWADLKGGAMADFMEEMFRTIRKLNGNITVITQRFLDVLDSDIGGALLANTSYYWFVGNKHDPAPLEKAVASSSNGTIALTQFDIKTIVECQSKRDFYLLTPFFSGLLKLYPSKEFAMVATTDPDDKNILRKYMKKFGTSYVTPEVIESARHEF